MSVFAVPDLLMRRLGESDASDLGLFFERNNRPEVTRFFHPFPLTRATAYKLLQPANRDLFFALMECGRIVAFSMLRGWDEGYDIPGFGIIVDRALQGQGFGRRLTYWTLRWADMTGCDNVRLTVHQANQSALHIYASLGFKETTRSGPDNGDLSVVMHRKRPLRYLPVYVSTQCLAVDEPLQERLDRLYAAGLQHIELSNYPVRDPETFRTSINEYPGRLMLHHYFPPVNDNVLLNLASADTERQQASLEFFERALDWTISCGAKYYSVHGGYLTDPVGRDDFGFIFPEPAPEQRRRALSCYIKNMVELANHARKHGIMLLVENNVVTPQHRGKLLLSTPEEFKTFLGQWPTDLPIGILLDWGHWQITANTLHLDMQGFADLSEYVVALHLHGNDCVSDSHAPFVSDGKTLSMLGEFSVDYVTLEGHYHGLSSLQNAVLELERVLV